MKHISKVLLITLLTLVLIFTLSACGNKGYGPGKFTFTHIHITDYNQGCCCDIEKWYDNDTGIEVRTVDGKGIFLSEGTYILFEREADCPFCK